MGDTVDVGEDVGAGLLGFGNATEIEDDGGVECTGRAAVLG